VNSVPQTYAGGFGGALSPWRMGRDSVLWSNRTVLHRGGHPRTDARGVVWYGVNNRGLSLVELVVASLVGIVILLGLSTFYLSTLRFYDQSSSQTQLQRQGTLIINEMSRRILFASRLVQDPPTDCPATPSLRVTQPGVTGFYCFYQSGNQLFERRPDGSDFDLLAGTLRPISVNNVVFTLGGYSG